MSAAWIQNRRTGARLRVIGSGAALREPNIVVRRRASGNVHATWFLASAVHTGDRSRAAPMRFVARVAEFYQVELLADAGFSGTLTLNPVWPGPEFDTWALHRAPYSLEALAEPIPARWRRPRIAQTGIGRNVDTFASSSRTTTSTDRACLRAAVLM